MARNPLIDAGVNMLTAIASLRLKGAFELVHVSDGVEIHMPRRPRLLLTQAAADDFAHEVAEALNGGSL